MRVVAVSALLFVFTGCAYLRPARGPLVTSSVKPGNGSCLLVLLPGVGDPPSRFEEHGFLEALARDPAGCEVMVADSHFGYYREGVITQRLGEVLAARRAQFDAVWLVGVSLGGYGAVLTARERPELVDGVVLISPFLGVPRSVRPVAQSIDSAGGLARYQPKTASLSKPQRHFVEVEPLWGWFASHARDSARKPKVVLAWGKGDGFAWKHELLAASPSVSSFSAPGAHDWDTFGSLFRSVALLAPWSEARGS